MDGIYKTCSHCKHRVLRQKYNYVLAYCTLHNRELSRFTDRHMHCDDFKLNPSHTYIKQ